MPAAQADRRRPFDFKAWRDDARNLAAWVLLNRWRLILAIGLLVRVVGYLKNRQFWMDEGSLLGNIIDKPVLDFWTPLNFEQVVPPIYLMLLRLLWSIFGEIRLILRLPSMICGILAFLLFYRYCKATMPEPAGLCCTALFACNADLIYYCSEMKPYAMDALVSVVAIRACGQFVNRAQIKISRLEFWFLAVSPWVSIASVFPVTALVLPAATMGPLKEWVNRKTAAWLILFLISFLSAYALEKRQVVNNSGLWTFWSFAFPKWGQPLQSLALLMDNLINPMHLLTPVSSLVIMSGWAAVVMFVLATGLVVIFQNNRPLGFYGITLGLIMLVVSWLRLYPLHGRTILCLVPMTILIFGTALTRLARWPNRYWRSLLCLLLVVPMISFSWLSPTFRGRPMLYDGDLQDDYFTHKFGLMSKQR